MLIIYSQSRIYGRKLRRRGIVDITDFISNFNYIGNLQLLEGLDNTSKKDKDYKEWFETNLPTAEAKREYCQRHLIPSDIDLSFTNFPEFFEAREALIIEKLKKELQ